MSELLYQNSPVTFSKVPIQGEALFHRLETEPCDCLVMGEKDGECCLMLIEQHGDRAERIGIIESVPIVFFEDYPIIRRKIRLA